MHTSIIWLRNDLRLADNEALNYVYQHKHKVLFVYIADPDIPIGSAAKWFLHQALAGFDQDIQQQYAAELVIKCGKPLDVLTGLIAQYAINSVCWNRVYEPQAIARDTSIKTSLQNMGVAVKSFNSSLLFEPSYIKNMQGSYFKVFTPFWKKCLTQIGNLSKPYAKPQSINVVKVNAQDSFHIEQLNLLPGSPNWAKNWSDLYKVSEAAVDKLADDFIANKVFYYQEGRDFPATHNTSGLSPYLHFGLISPRQIYYKTQESRSSGGLDTFLSEIGWREFAYYLLYHFNQLPEKNFKAKFDNFPWENNSQDLKRWQEGMTGFPIIDAGMRQLWHTGWMHNRVRMLVASFLTKNLLIDWRLGQAWFWDCLVDADLAANSASWQWVAGSGADAAPYFRIFNPITQSQKFDPKGEYIKRWVPEISHLSVSDIHFPLNHLRGSYPQAIVDIKSSRTRALAIYKSI